MTTETGKPEIVDNIRFVNGGFACISRDTEEEPLESNTFRAVGPRTANLRFSKLEIFGQEVAT